LATQTNKTVILKDRFPGQNIWYPILTSDFWKEKAIQS